MAKRQKMPRLLLGVLMLCLLVGCGEIGGPGSSRPTEPGSSRPTETETAPPEETPIPMAEASPPEGSVGPDDPAGPETPEPSPAPDRGDLTEDTAVLWSEERGSEGVRDQLTLERDGERWYIRSFLQVSQGEFAED